MKHNNIRRYLLLAVIIVLVITIVIMVARSVIGTATTEIMVDKVADEIMVDKVAEPAIQQDKTPPSPSDISSNSDLLYLVIIILSLTTLFSIGISFYLYKWRKILLSNANMVVPEEWAKSLNEMSSVIKILNKVVDKNLHMIADEARNNSTKISGMTDTYMQLQSSLDDKDKEIKRFRDGYDAEIFTRFISRFARINQSVDDFLLEDGGNSSLHMLSRLFEDAFDECGVSKYEPDIGSDYRKAVGVSDNPKVEMTDNPEEEFLICEIIESGYKLNRAINQTVILPSKVKIYKLG